MPPSKLSIKSSKELAFVLDTEVNYLYAMARLAPGAYKCWERPKKTGGARKISSPNRLLKSLQRKIHDKVFSKIDFGDFSHYGIRKRSNVTNALVHKDSKILFQIDLESFFPSIRPERVRKALIVEQGCTPEVASLLTKLVTYDFELPQGAPTSTDIANIVTLRLQRRLCCLDLASVKWTPGYTAGAAFSYSTGET